MEKIKEQLADLEHEQWAHWMRYMFSCGKHTEEGWLMPSEKVERWTRQMNTPYAELTEKEKASDREWANKVINIINPEAQASE